MNTEDTIQGLAEMIMKVYEHQGKMPKEGILSSELWNEIGCKELSILGIPFHCDPAASPYCGYVL